MTKERTTLDSVKAIKSLKLRIVKNIIIKIE